MFKLFSKKDKAEPKDTDGYHVFTTEFDQVISGDEIHATLGFCDQTAWIEQMQEYDKNSAIWKERANMAMAELVRDFTAALPDDFVDDTVACLLVDHSGSLRGERAMISCAITELVAECWSDLGIKYEILGFTTSSWKGGQSRRKWRNQLTVTTPGRLCDLLHIVYRTADSVEQGAPWAVRNVLREELLKENVDGEALLWAADRLKARPEKRKIVVVLSDGAPIDDSTLTYNHETILTDHIQSVISELKNEDVVTVGAIGIKYEVSGYYDTSIAFETAEDIDETLPKFALEVLASP